ncbi:MAG: hypothetical protein ABL307_01300 [Roseitalea porphyridii]|uniref:DUF1254 domain-containing protein n=1 Tax=Roseitalea porphyridii TaxID=1852022 RepID=UPI0032D966F6
MTRLFYATLVGLVGAAVVHLVVIFLLPLVSTDTAWNRVAAQVAEHEPMRPGDERDALGAGAYGPDPFFVTVICRYDLRAGALHVRSPGLAPLWTVGVHDSLGTVIFSANDRLVAGRRLDLAVVDASQLRFVRQNAPPELANAIIAPAARPTGFVTVRAFRPDPTWDTVIERFVDELACEPLDF